MSDHVPEKKVVHRVPFCEQEQKNFPLGQLKLAQCPKHGIPTIPAIWRVRATTPWSPLPANHLTLGRRSSSSDGYSFFAGRWTDAAFHNVGSLARSLAFVGVGLLQARAPRQKATFFHRAAAGHTGQATARNSIYTSTMHSCAREHGLTVWAGRERRRSRGSRYRLGAGDSVHKRAGMGDLIGFGMFGTNRCNACVGGFAGFGKGIITRVEVFAFLGSCQGLFMNSVLGSTSYLQLILQKILLVW